MELDLTWLKAAMQRWEVKPKPLFEDEYFKNNSGCKNKIMFFQIYKVGEEIGHDENNSTS